MTSITAFRKERADLLNCSTEDLKIYVKGLDQEFKKAEEQKNIDWQADIETEKIFCNILLAKMDYIESLSQIQKNPELAPYLAEHLKEKKEKLERFNVQVDEMTDHWLETGEIL